MKRTKMSHSSWDVELKPNGEADYKCYARQIGGGRASLMNQIPKDVGLALDINPGDPIEITIKKVIE